MRKIIVFFLVCAMFFLQTAFAAPDFSSAVEDRYDFIHENNGGDEEEADQLYAVEKDDRWGFINAKGVEVTPLIYDFTSYFTEGIGLVYIDEKVGAVNIKGELVVPIIYDCEVITYSGGVFGLKKDGNAGYVTIEGAEIGKFIYDEVGSFSEGLGMVIKEEKMGFLNKSGRLVIPLIYDAVVCPNCGSYHASDIFFSEGISPVRKDGKWGYIFTDGRVALPFIYDDAKNFWDGEALVVLDGKMGYIDRQGKKLRGFIYEDIDEYFFSNSGATEAFSDYIAVKNNGKWGVISRDYSKVIIPCIYDELDFNQYYSKKYICVQVDDKYGYIDMENNIVFPIIIDWFHLPSEGLIGYSTKDKAGFMDMHMNAAIEPRFDEISPFSESRAKVQIDGLYGFIDKRGEVVIPAIYQDAIDFSEGLAAVQLEDEWGFVDKWGKVVIPFEYMGGGEFHKGLALIKSGLHNNIRSETDQACVIDKKGRVIVPEMTYDTLMDTLYSGKPSEYSKKVESSRDKMSDWALTEDLGVVQDYETMLKEIDYDYRNPMTRQECALLLSWVYHKTTGEFFPHPTKNPFTDTSDIDVRTAYEAGLVFGTGGGHYKPDNLVSRQDFCVMLSRLIKLVNNDGDKGGTTKPVSFTDYDSIADYAKDAVELLGGLDIVRGSGGKLLPHSQITREQALAMADRIILLFGQEDLWLSW